MLRLFSSVHKELLLLWRDRPNLALIYLMPLVLVLVVSLVQEGAFKALQETKIRMLLLNQDRGPMGQSIEQGLRSSGFFILHKIPSQDAMRKAVAKGRFQVGILIPPHTTEHARKYAQKIAIHVLKTSVQKKGTKALTPPKRQPVPLQLYFDPAIRTAFRNAVLTSLARFTEKIEMRTILDAILKGYSDALPNELQRCMKRIMGPSFRPTQSIKTPRLFFPWRQSQLLSLQVHTASQAKSAKTPTSVQQNVPAWALFAMFFIVIPLSSNLIQERTRGTLLRLLTLPTPRLTMIGAKLLVYLGVCLSQFLLMIAIGKFVLPRLGTPVLTIGQSPLAVALIAVAAGLAAIGFGMLLGSLCRTQEQAALIGSVSIVVGAAIGGLMVPSFVMPAAMRTLGTLSPLGWALDAFLDLFARGGNLLTVWPNLLLLLAFFILTMLVSLKTYFRQT